jgi:hypothetical protein|nr:MAG TPA: hypothetical protein [Caudoviricetes sp.]DAM70775.1 MAG TPA: hypothetical protein [Caudoviricetes sp.]
MSKKKEEKLSSLVGVQGFEHVQQFLSGLPKIGKERAIESGLKAGGKLLKEGGKRRLRAAMKRPQGVSGNMLKAFSVKLKKRKSGVLVGFVVPKKAKDPKREGIKVRTADEGSKPRVTSKGKKTGAMPSLKRFWTRTKNEDTPAALRLVAEGIKKASAELYAKYN